MNIILLERIQGLGQMGDEVTVKDGYARNFLLPQQKALRATAGNRTHFKAQQAQIEAENLTKLSDAKAAAEKMEGLHITLIRQAGDSGQLYGSVNARDVADAVHTAGFSIDRKQVSLEKPVKTLGLHPVRVTLHPEVYLTIIANVARSEEEAITQAKTGTPLVSEESRVEETDKTDKLDDSAEGAVQADATEDASSI